MTQEEAGRRKTEESSRPGEHALSAPSNDSVPATSSGRGRDGESGAMSPVMSPDVEKTMRKAQKQADKATPSDKGRSASEEEKPDRTLRTTEEGRSNALLPVVQEAGESGDANAKDNTRREKKDGWSWDEGVVSSPTPLSSIPPVRKVSPSTVGTMTDFGDDTSMSSPQRQETDLESISQLRLGQEVDDIPDHILDREFEKPPRIGSDFIKPQSPLGETVFKSLDAHVEADK